MWAATEEYLQWCLLPAVTEVSSSKIMQWCLLPGVTDVSSSKRILTVVPAARCHWSEQQQDNTCSGACCQVSLMWAAPGNTYNGACCQLSLKWAAAREYLQWCLVPAVTDVSSTRKYLQWCLLPAVTEVSSSKRILAVVPSASCHWCEQQQENTYCTEVPAAKCHWYEQQQENTYSGICCQLFCWRWRSGACRVPTRKPATQFLL